MAKFCDRTPCTRLIQILGLFLFGNDSGGYTLIVYDYPNNRSYTVEIDYCPFCGHRLEKLQFERGRVLALGTSS
jgi:hypothetical protein